MEAIHALFSTYEQAQAAIQLLLDRRFRLESMNLIVQDTVAKDRLRGQLGRSNVAASEMGPGLDRLVAGEQARQVPEVGSVYVVGSEASTLARTAAEAQSHRPGLQAALEEYGMPAEVAAETVAGLRRGALLLWLRVEDERAPEAAMILREQKGQAVASFVREGQPG